MQIIIDDTDDPMTKVGFLIGILDYWQLGPVFGPESRHPYREALSRLFLLHREARLG